ncbi:MAG: flagellar assembly protein FliW [Huintestinicola sp.]
MQLQKNLIRIRTRDFDEIEVSPDQIIEFPKGIFAFEEYTKYIIITPLGDGKFPVWLQSAENPGLCFILFDPYEFCRDYAVAVPDEDVKALEITKDSQLQFFVISVIPENYMDATVNMKSPIILNTDNLKAAQVIAENDYPIKFPVFAKTDAKGDG